MPTTRLDHTTVRAALALANRAPSVHNFQPWATDPLPLAAVELHDGEPSHDLARARAIEVRCRPPGQCRRPTARRQRGPRVTARVAGRG
jgi:hypothetical protein